MDPATTAIMILLSCSPDMLFCRKVSQPAAMFRSAAECEAVLPAEIQRLAGENRIIGRCQLAGVANVRVQWARLPDSTLMTAIGRADSTSTAKVEIDETSIASVNASSNARQSSLHPQRKSAGSDKDYVTVQVTRMNGDSPITTPYLVKRSE